MLFRIIWVDLLFRWFSFAIDYFSVALTSKHVVSLIDLHLQLRRNLGISVVRPINCVPVTLSADKIWVSFSNAVLV